MRKRVVAITIWLALCTAQAGWADQAALPGRCATGTRGDEVTRFAPPAPMRLAISETVREAAVALPTLIDGNILVRAHVRVIWGDGYDAADPQWQPDAVTGNPIWVERLADALEYAWQVQEALGFAPPYGAPDYYLDAYVANTGVRVRESDTAHWGAVTMPAFYYAYTDVHPAGACYFVFGDDYSGTTVQELAVLDAVAAHELFHAVQRADYPWNDEVAVPDSIWWREGWFMEATATWMEEVVFPEVDDYVAFVTRFLSRPEYPLTLKNGSHEYGAAVFAGYLWLEHGAQAFWQEVLTESYDPVTPGGDLEAALETALADRGDPAFAEVTAQFWARAADPWPGEPWPDAALYTSNGAPYYTVEGAAPFAVHSEDSDLSWAWNYTNPYPSARLGANLYRVRADGPFRLEARMVESTGEGDGLRIALARPGQPPELHLAGNGAAPLALDPVDFPGQEWITFALVNVSASDGTLPHFLYVRGDGDGGDGGGCFLQSLPKRNGAAP